MKGFIYPGIPLKSLFWGQNHLEDCVWGRKKIAVTFEHDSRVLSAAFM
jgi:hypothetical protein